MAIFSIIHVLSTCCGWACKISVFCFFFSKKCENFRPYKNSTSWYKQSAEHTMKKSLCCSLDISDERQFQHGGDIRLLAEKAGCKMSELLDFSASINPLGSPAWLGQEMGRAAEMVASYPDHQASDVCLAACELYKVWPTQLMAGNGASELLWAAAMDALRWDKVTQAVIPVPTYSDYERLCTMIGLKTCFIQLEPEKKFDFDPHVLLPYLKKPSLVFLAQPNNPTGTFASAQDICNLAAEHPLCRFIVDESFAEFVPHMERLVRNRPDNVIVVQSLTKFYAIPGLRLGLAFAAPESIHRMKKLLPSWSTNIVAQRVGARALRDYAYQAATRTAVRDLRERLATTLRWFPSLTVFPSEANYLLCRTNRLDETALPLAEKLLSKRIAIRVCDNFRGLNSSYFRIGIRSEEDNLKLTECMEEFYGIRKSPVILRKPKKPALMIQGTCSNAGKSVLSVALCRIFLQDGYSVAPFKAQNMSNNSFVTKDGGEMGRAQVTQAMACGLEPDVRMNPILLKPSSDIGSQVVLMGRALGNMNVHEYTQVKPELFTKVTAAYDALSSEHDVMLIEGAGSPAEINLKQHDIVNMKMAEYAEAQVVLVGDIDRGGVFASLLGTMELLEEAERARICGFILNRFRGDKSLLEPAISAIFGRTGKPILGTVPYIPHLGLPEEDSLTFKTGCLPCNERVKETECVDIAIVDLGHISNFNDFDALACEPDVNLRVVSSPHDMGRPDAVILPGSKSTVADMKVLKGMGMAATLRSLAHKTQIIGICGGFQMLGLQIDDPLGIETRDKQIEGFGILPLRTTMAEEKTLKRTLGRHEPSGLSVKGYEIHHGQSKPLSDSVRACVVRLEQGSAIPIGYALSSGRVWGTYLHGIFDEDEFRRWFINGLRVHKGLPALAISPVSYELESSFDNLASLVRDALDMNAIYAALGMNGSAQASLPS